MISAPEVITRAGGRQAAGDRLGVVPGARVGLPDAGDEEDLVVHRQAEQHGEEERREAARR